jgi:uncharacterized protein DUF5681
MIERVRRRVRAPQKGGPRSSSGASYRVGYGRPPKDHRFQPGQSGNRKGRPKGAKNTVTLLREILDRKIEVRTGGTVGKISVREAILTRFAEAALKGDTKSAGFLLQRYDMPETAEEHAINGATPDEQQIIDAYLETILKDGGKKK